jgi:hypothetical protein
MCQNKPVCAKISHNGHWHSREGEIHESNSENETDVRGFSPKKKRGITPLQGA